MGYREDYSEKTRVLHIRGPARVMTFEFWNGYFQQCVAFQLEGFRELPSPREGIKVLEFRFSRIDGQAEAIHTAITKDSDLDAGIEIRYGPDLCDPHSGFR